MSDKLAESKNEHSKLKLAADNAAQLKKITPTRTIKVHGPFWIHIDSSTIWNAIAMFWSVGLRSGIRVTGLSGCPRLYIEAMASCSI